MQRIARDPAVGGASSRPRERDRLPGQRRAHGARDRRRSGATATSPRPRAGTRSTWRSASTSRTRARAATGSATACATAGYGDPGDGWRAGEDLGWGTGDARDAQRARRRLARQRPPPAHPALAAYGRSASASPAGAPKPTGSEPAGRDLRDGPGDDPRLDRISRGMTATAPSGARYGVTSMVAPLQRVLVRRPALAGDWDGAGWRTPDPAELERQHEAFVELLDGLGAEVEVADALDGQVDAVYMHDPLILSGRGGIPLNMAKPARMREPGHAAEALRGRRRPGPRHARRATPTPTAATASGSTTRPPRSASATAPTARARRGSRSCSSPRASTSRPTTCRTTRAPRTSCTCSRSCSAATERLFVVYEPLAPVRLLQDIRERGIE